MSRRTLRSYAKQRRLPRGWVVASYRQFRQGALARHGEWRQYFDELELGQGDEAVKTQRRLTHLYGLRRVLRDLRWELRAIALDAPAGLARQDLPAPPLKLHLACGGASRDGWINIDLSQRRAVDLTLDLRERLPLPDGCAEIVHAEHFLEHLEFPAETMRFLAECRRLLQPGGILSLSVPDAGDALHAYVRGDDSYFAPARNRGMHPDDESATYMAQVNYLFRHGGKHRYAFDGETLCRYLDAAGLSDVRIRAWDPELDRERWRGRGTLRIAAVRA